MNEFMLLVRIELERDKMHRLAAEHGLGDERTIRQSQRSDKLLLAAQRSRVKKGVAVSAKKAICQP